MGVITLPSLPLPSPSRGAVVADSSPGGPVAARGGWFEKWRLEVVFEENIPYVDYTGKLVKTLVAAASSELGSVLEARGMRVKPLSLSPLYYRGQGGAVKALYPRARGPEGGPAGGYGVEIRAGRRYWFHVGYGDALAGGFRGLLTALMAGVEIPSRVGAVGVRLVSATRLIRYEPAAGPLYSPRPGVFYKVVAMSPLLPASPFHEGSRVKRLTVAPVYVFSVNTRVLLGGVPPEALRALDLLTPSPSAGRTMFTAWYIYDGDALPGLAGYVKYMVDDTVEPSAGELSLLGHILSHAAAMGAGTGRAAGFGDLRVEAMEAGGGEDSS